MLCEQKETITSLFKYLEEKPNREQCYFVYLQATYCSKILSGVNALKILPEVLMASHR